MARGKPRPEPSAKESPSASQNATEKPKPTVESVSRTIATARKQDIFLYNGPIDDEHFGSLVVNLGKKEYDRVLLILCTYGGEANSAYRVARFLNRVYDGFDIYVPSFCKSAGTLLALGAHEIIMSDFAELGPLDVQLYKADELGERRSGLIIRSAMESLAEHAFELFETTMLNIKERSFGRVRFTTAADLAAQITVGALSSVYQQVDPINVGEDHRDLNVAIQYGNRLAQRSGNVKSGAVEKLVRKYPAHDFVIDIEEARELFNRVESPNKNLYMLTALLREEAIQPKVRNGVVRRLSKSDAETEEATKPKGTDNHAEPQRQPSEEPAPTAPPPGNGAVAPS